MIYYSTPYSTDKKLGKYYNSFMELLPKDDDFACFVDGDTIFTTPSYGHTIEKVIAENTKVSCFTCYTNRVACLEQIAPGVDTESNDINYHRNFGTTLENIYGSYCSDITVLKDGQYISGCMILLKKELWRKLDGFDESGMLGVDTNLHRKIRMAEEKIYLMHGVYIYHWYRWPNCTDKSHLV